MEQLSRYSKINAEVEFMWIGTHIKGVVKEIIDEILIVKVNNEYIDLLSCDEIGFQFDYLDLDVVKVKNGDDEKK